MKLHRLTLTNFGSFRGEKTFHFPDAPGLYFMQGINEAEPRLEGNGTGKTTIWKALCWLIFGKTPDGLKAGDVCNWSASKGVVVELAYETEGAVSMQVMRRTWGPISWTLTDLFGNKVDLVKDPTNAALGALRLDFMPFLHSVLMAQGEPMFLDLKREHQAELFSSVMQLDKWLDASAEASRRASQQDRETRGLESAVAKLRGKLEASVDYQEDIAQWKAKQRVRIRELDADYEAIYDKYEKVGLGLTKLEAEEAEAREAYKQAVEDATALSHELEPLQEQSRELDQKVGKLEAKLDAAERHLKFFVDHESCPTCLQTIPTAMRRKQTAEAREEVEEATDAFDAAHERRDKINAQVKGKQAEHQQLQRKVQDKRERLQDAEQATRRCRTDLGLLERQMEGALDAIDRAKAEANPFQRLADEADLERRKQMQELREVQRDLERSESLHSMFSFWVRGFKDLRLHQIAEALTELEVEVNSCAASLGLLDWELRFAVDRETKGGTIQRGFNVEVVGPNNPKPVPWESWSGGEKQRLRIAATMGLANLVRGRTGCAVPLEVWDEPSQGLSKQGVQDMLESLVRRAKIEQRQIWVVDHTAHAFGDFAGGATIIRNPSGSTIRQY